MSAPPDHWQRLGDVLVNRRVQLDPRYTNRRTFVEETHGGKHASWYRVITSIETGARSNYTRETIAAVERAYQMEPGSVKAIIDGGRTSGLAASGSGLEAALDARRQELDKAWRDIAIDAGISYETLRALRRGDNEPSTLTKRRLERALRWETGSLDEVLAGGEALPLASEPAIDPAPVQVILQSLVCCRCLLSGSSRSAVTLVAGNAVCVDHAREELNRG